MRSDDQYQDGTVLTLKLAKGQRDATLGKFDATSSPQDPPQKTASPKAVSKKPKSPKDTGQADLF